MPFFYDLQRTTTTNGSANTETIHMAGKTVANQETVGIYGIIACARSLTAGGAQLRTKSNTTGGTVFSGGTAQTPTPKNVRGSVAAQSSWVNDATAITAGTTLIVRSTVGFAQTGGTGGLQPIMQQAAYQMMPNTTNPVDMEWSSIAATASIAVDITLEIGEGI
jgi:hypothetical protein